MKKRMKSFRFDEITEYALRTLSRKSKLTESETLRLIILHTYIQTVKREAPQ